MTLIFSYVTTIEEHKNPKDIVFGPNKTLPLIFTFGWTDKRTSQRRDKRTFGRATSLLAVLTHLLVVVAAASADQDTTRATVYPSRVKGYHFARCERKDSF